MTNQQPAQRLDGSESGLSPLPTYADLMTALIRISECQKLDHARSTALDVIEAFRRGANGRPQSKPAYVSLLGVPGRPGFKRTALEDRLWSRVKKGGRDECWPWLGGCIPSGHGRLGLGGRDGGATYSHILAWKLTFGEVPSGMFVCHKCDNPPCCNPDHLFLGTPTDNIRDAAGKFRSVRGKKVFSAKLCDDDVREIRRLAKTSMLQKDIAAKFGVCRETIRIVARGTAWTHVR